MENGREQTRAARKSCVRMNSFRSLSQNGTPFKSSRGAYPFQSPTGVVVLIVVDAR